MPNASTRLSMMCLSMSLKRMFSGVHVLVVWIFQGHSTHIAVNAAVKRHLETRFCSAKSLLWLL
jgi:hypothetical protein